MELACTDCSTRWTPPARSPFKEGLGALLVALSMGCAIGMLIFLSRDNTTLGGGLAIGAMACLGVGAKLRGTALPRCPQCGRLGQPPSE